MTAVIIMADPAPIVSTAELLEWHDATTCKPDADTTVLMWFVDSDGHGQWESGWWSGDGRWCFCESGGDVGATVTHWAEPEGPDCLTTPAPVRRMETT